MTKNNKSCATIEDAVKENDDLWRATVKSMSMESGVDVVAIQDLAVQVRDIEWCKMQVFTEAATPRNTPQNIRRE